MAGLRGSYGLWILAGIGLLAVFAPHAAATCCYKAARDGDCIPGLIASTCASRTGFTFDEAAVDCEDVEVCRRGCCCDPQGSRQGTISLPFKCSSADQFYAYNDPRLPFRVSNPRDIYNYLEKCDAFCANRPPPEPPEPTTHTVRGLAKGCTGLGAARQCTPYADVTVYWPRDTQAGPQVLSDRTNAQGQFQLTGIPHQSRVRLYAFHADCDDYESPTVVEVNEDKDLSSTPLELTCGTTPQTCPAPAKPTAAWTVTKAEVKLRWTLPHACERPHYFQVRRCYGHKALGDATDVCWILGTTTQTEFTDTAGLSGLVNNPPPNLPKKLFYDVAIVVAGIPSWSPETELPLADPACIRGTHAEGQFCAAPAASTPDTAPQPHTCGESNQLIRVKKPDGTDLVCQAPARCVRTPQKRAVCQTEDPCASCNGILGMFAILGMRWTEPCNRPDCIIDSTVTPADAYFNCADKSCFAYLSKRECDANRCQFPNGCRWDAENAGTQTLSELGLGRCLPLDTADPGNCAQCRGTDCGPDDCHSLGDCYYDGSDQNRPCKNKDEMACLYYDAREDCIDSSHSTFPPSDAGDARFDVRWPPDPSATHPAGGSHTQQKPSRDYFSFGTCAWVEYGDGSAACVKDADNRRLATPSPAGAPMEDDCLAIREQPTNLACVGDNAPPATAINLENRQTYRLADVVNLAALVTDDHATQAQLRTFFCLMPAVGGDPCYPDKTREEIIQDFWDRFPQADGGPGKPSPEWKLRYFSKDLAQNYEPIQERTFGILTPLGVHITAVRLT